MLFLRFLDVRLCTFNQPHASHHDKHTYYTHSIQIACTCVFCYIEAMTLLKHIRINNKIQLLAEESMRRLSGGISFDLHKEPHTASAAMPSPFSSAAPIATGPANDNKDKWIGKRLRDADDGKEEKPSIFDSSTPPRRVLERRPSISQRLSKSLSKIVEAADVACVECLTIINEMEVSPFDFVKKDSVGAHGDGWKEE